MDGGGADGVTEDVDAATVAAAAPHDDEGPLMIPVTGTVATAAAGGSGRAT